MIWLFLCLILTTLLSSYYQIKLALYFALVISIQICFAYLNFISLLVFFIVFIPTFLFSLLFNFKKFRRKLISKPLFGHFNHASNPWKNFQRIDDGWFASDFERSVFQGNPNFCLLYTSPSPRD